MLIARHGLKSKDRKVAELLKDEDFMGLPYKVQLSIMVPGSPGIKQKDHSKFTAGYLKKLAAAANDLNTAYLEMYPVFKKMPTYISFEASPVQLLDFVNE